ncbi:very short patch repair endonuclease [Mesorhizobium sp. M0115]
MSAIEFSFAAARKQTSRAATSEVAVAPTQIVWEARIDEYSVVEQGGINGFSYVRIVRVAIRRMNVLFPDVPVIVRRRMARIRGKATRPELLVRQTVRALGIGYRLNRRDLPGSPDLVFKGRKKVIFVHGCFWHQHGCKLTGKAPQKRAEYWAPKLKRNVKRDQEAQQRLEELGYRALTIWECEVSSPSLPERIAKFLKT